MLHMRLALYEGNNLVAIMPNPSSVQVAMPLNDTPTLSFSHPPFVGQVVEHGEEYATQDLPGLYALLKDRDIAVQFSVANGTWIEPPSCRFVITEDEADPGDPAGQFSVTAMGVDMDLAFVVGLDGTKFNKEGKRRFSNATPGTYIRTMLLEGQAEGLATMITHGFTNTHDSNGAPWPSVLSMDLGPEITLRQLLDSLSSQGLIDWRFQGNELKVFVADTYMRQNRPGVELALGREFLTAPQRRMMQNVVDKVLVIGADGLLLRRDNVTWRPRGGRGAVITQGGVSQVATATLLADHELQKRSVVREELTRDMVFNDRHLYLPFRDYGVGDLVMAPDLNGGLAQLRAVQITITQDEDGVVGGNVMFNDRLLEAIVRQSRRIEGIVGGSTIAGGTNAIPAPPPATKIYPAIPTGLNASTSTDGITATVVVTWNAVTTNEDGESISGTITYPIEWRKNGGAWSIGETRDPVATFGDFEMGATYEFQVRASHDGYHGHPSGVVSIQAAQDEEPPPVPSAPVLELSPGVIHIHWNGKTEAGSSTWPPDFVRVDVLVDGAVVDSFTSASSTVLVSTPGDDRAVTLVAVDRSGNQSLPSVATVGAAPSVLDDPDLADRLGIKSSIYRQDATPTGTFEQGDLWFAPTSGILKQWDGSAWTNTRMDAAQVLVAGSILANQIGAGQIEADHIDVGAITADKLALGVISTNPVFDPGFEDYTYPILQTTGRGWTLAGSGDYTADRAYSRRSGTWGGRMGVGSTASWAELRSEPFEVTPGERHNVTAWFAIVGSAARNVQIDLRTGTSALGTTYSTIPTDTTAYAPAAATYDPATASVPASAFQKLSREATIPAGHAWARVVLRVPAGPVGSVFWDDVSSIEIGPGASELTAAGLRLFDSQGDEVAAFVSNRPNTLSVVRDGATLAAIRDDGTIMGRNLNIVGDPVFGGKPLSASLNERPRGILRWTAYNGQHSFLANSEYGIVEFPFQSEPGRSFGLEIFPPSFYSTGGLASIWWRLRYTTDGSTPTINSPLHEQWSDAASLAGEWTKGTPMFFPMTDNRPFRFLLTAARGSGPGNLTVGFYPGTSTGRIFVHDLGYGFGQKLIGWQWNAGGGTQTSPSQNLSGSWASSAWRTYSGSDVQRTGVSSAYFGYYGATWGNQWSRFDFPTTELSGATINSATLTFTVQHTYQGSGAPLRVFRGGKAGDLAWEGLVAAGGTYTVALNPPALAAATNTFGFGPGSSNSQSTYGYIDPASVRLNVNYTK